jgi:hypothetical protein
MRSSGDVAEPASVAALCESSCSAHRVPAWTDGKKESRRRVTSHDMDGRSQTQIRSFIMMDMPKPGAPHQQLAKLAGTWTGDEIIGPSPFDPKGRKGRSAG